MEIYREREYWVMEGFIPEREPENELIRCSGCGDGFDGDDLVDGYCGECLKIIED